MTSQEEQMLLDAAVAQRARQASHSQYALIDSIAALEALRAGMETGQERDSLDALLVQRRRTAKASLENLGVLGDLYDKAALPAAAALPVLLTLLVSERLIGDTVRTWLLLSAYLVGGALWALCRWMSYRYSKEARNGAATLGKVD